MSIRIRAARRADLPAVYRVLESAFTDTPIQLFIDQTERDSTLRMRQVRVAEVDGRISAHVRVFARRMMIRGVPVPAGGIGSVASMPDARGLGLPSALLHDAIDLMARDGMPVSFLFTGIPAFYERLGWRIVNQPSIEVAPSEAVALPDDRAYRIRRMADADVPRLLAIHRAAIAGTTGAVVRTARTWRDAQRWLGEDRASCLVAESAGRAVAYVRARFPLDRYSILEAECERGHERAITALVARAGRRALALTDRLHASTPEGHPLTQALRSLPSAVEHQHMRYPTMIRIVSLDALVDALLPQLRERARLNAGPPFTLGLRAPDRQSLTLAIGATSVRATHAPATYRLDESATLDAILGQRRASDLVRPRPPAAVRARIDALLPETPFHFWNTDRI